MFIKLVQTKIALVDYLMLKCLDHSKSFAC